MATWVTGKIWQLVEGAEEEDLLVLIEEQIEPRYAELNADVRLGLLRMDDRQYLTTQHWPDRAAWEAATGSEAYEHWLERYRPVLALWDATATFVSEWAGEEIR